MTEQKSVQSRKRGKIPLPNYLIQLFLGQLIPNRIEKNIVIIGGKMIAGNYGAAAEGRKMLFPLDGFRHDDSLFDEL